MSVSLISLPYPETALEPAISAQTLAVHHGKHHRAYVDKTNELIAGTSLADASLNSIVVAAAVANDTKLFNQAAQAWNHGFYWHSLTPNRSAPDGALAEAIASTYGSAEKLCDVLIEQGVGHFGSGWAWLVADGKDLSIVTTHDAGCPLADGNKRPLLVIDVWEHAYYLDRKNDRKAYLTAAARLLDWNFASENFSRGEPWTYPS
ncbi:MAG: superoxide dismutase [Sphingomonadales bacterium]|nr:superoxide dismutase [Sphingomonadales bacterium]